MPHHPVERFRSCQVVLLPQWYCLLLQDRLRSAEMPPVFCHPANVAVELWLHVNTSFEHSWTLCKTEKIRIWQPQQTSVPYWDVSAGLETFVAKVQSHTTKQVLDAVRSWTRSSLFGQSTVSSGIGHLPTVSNSTAIDRFWRLSTTGVGCAYFVFLAILGTAVATEAENRGRESKHMVGVWFDCLCLFSMFACDKTCYM